MNLLRDALKRDRSITYNWHDPQTSYLEAIFSRGDRRLADVLEHAWQNGAKFDSWSEYFDFQRDVYKRQLTTCAWRICPRTG